MGKYNIGEVWWVHFPFQDKEEVKRRPAIIIDDETIAIMAMYVTSQEKEDNPYSILIEDWKEAGLTKESWTRIDKVVSISEWYFDRKIGDLSGRDLIKIMQLVEEISAGITHDFSLVAICDRDGRYLQKYDTRWLTWLFPYTRSNDNNKANVDDFASHILGEETETKYVTSAKHCKYSVSDNVYKIYNHKLYKVLLENVPGNMSGDEFIIDGEKYRWMSMMEMEQDERIMDVNEEVIAFVKAFCC